MTHRTSSTLRSIAERLISLALAVTACLAARPSFAEDWGAYQIVPASATNLVLEAVGSGTTEGTVVSIGRPAGTPNQKWIITPKGNDFYSIRPTHGANLVLAASRGGKAMGTFDRARGRSRRTLAGMGFEEE